VTDFRDRDRKSEGELTVLRCPTLHRSKNQSLAAQCDFLEP
jgi:hypothetical protein